MTKNELALDIFIKAFNSLQITAKDFDFNDFLDGLEKYLIVNANILLDGSVWAKSSPNDCEGNTD